MPKKIKPVDQREKDAALLEDIYINIVKEYSRGIEKHGTYSSMHEAKAVIEEELEETWDEIKKDNQAGAVREAYHVAATALKFIVRFSKKEV